MLGLAPFSHTPGNVKRDVVNKRPRPVMSVSSARSDPTEKTLINTHSSLVTYARSE